MNHPDLNANTALLVDIGAGRGHDLIGFRILCTVVRKRVLQNDISAVIEEAHGLERTQQCWTELMASVGLRAVNSSGA